MRCILSCFIVTVWIVKAMMSQETDVKGDLIFAQILYRHGDRTPIDPYPTDPWGDLKYWPTGWGQLTNIGKMQHFKLGQWLKARYSSILNDTYSKDSLYVRATDVDRTLMSALSNLAGMYPPMGKDVWNTNISWQPVPVHTVPEKEDSILAAKKPCPAYDHELAKLKQSDEFRKMEKRFTPLYEYLSDNTGQTINTFEHVQWLNNTFYIESLYNRTLPEWTKKVYPGNNMTWISAYSFATHTYTRKLARLKTGPLLKEMLHRFLDKFQGKLKPNRSLWVYSAHDVTVASLLNTLKLFEYHSPPYTACVMLEMRKRSDGEAYLSVFYKNSSDEPRPMFIPNCGIECPLKTMFKLYNDVLPSDWDYECKLSMLSMTYEEADFGYTMAILFGATMAILLLISIYTCVIYFRRKSYFDYRWYVQIES